MSEQFVANYIEIQISKGKSTPKDICVEAQEEIEALDREIKKIEKLRTRQNNLHSVIRQLGGQDLKRDPKKIITIDSSVSEDELDSYLKTFCIKICDFIEKCSGPTNPREIMDEVGSLQENKITYTAIKWLLEQGIISRLDNGPNRFIVQGENWSNRPKVTSN